MTHNSHHGLLVDAAVYVLDAMEPAEAARYHDHLAGCVECREEVAALERVVDRLALSPPQYATPPTLRAAVLRSVDAERRRADRRPPQWTMSFLSLAPRPLHAVAFGTLAALFAAFTLGLLSGTSPRRVQARVQHTAGQAELEVSGGHGTLILRRFPGPLPGHVYEVWLERRSGRPSPTRTLFSVTATGAAEIGLPERLRGVRDILVTEERAGGSVVSTHRPLIIAQVS